MKSASDALIALLASRAYIQADLYTFTLQTGTVLQYTSSDHDITTPSGTFLCGGVTGPFFDIGKNRTRCNWKLGLEASTMTFDVSPGDATINGVSFLAACKNGVFDGADFQLERGIMPLTAPGDSSAGTVILFVGRVAELDAGRTLATFNIADHRELLDINTPKNIFQPGCMNTFGDTACGINKAALAVTGSITSGSTQSLLNASLAAATGYFDLGVITFTSGPNAGISRSVKTYTHGTTIKLMSPLPSTPTTGDAFTIYPGCARTTAACIGYNNLAKFRGFPYIPAVSTAT